MADIGEQGGNATAARAVSEKDLFRAAALVIVASFGLFAEALQVLLFTRDKCIVRVLVGRVCMCVCVCVCHSTQ